MNSFIECQNNPKELNVLDHSQNKQYGEGKNFTSKVINSCHMCINHSLRPDGILQEKKNTGAFVL